LNDTDPASTGSGRAMRPPSSRAASLSQEFRFSPNPNRAADVRWRPWGDDAFREAAAAGKPILLSISAVWCHWCHVMDETSYSDREVIEAVNERFVPVRVDTDRRPDVNRRYNAGGWPSTVFLTPQGDILAGATYLPPDRMLSALDQVQEYYREHPTQPPRRPEMDLAKEIREADAEATARGELSRETMVLVCDTLSELYDPDYGGLGAEPKFPQAEALSALLVCGVYLDDPSCLDVVTTSLRAMAAGGVHDGVEGGFFRYATRRDWSQPHYEKMLDDNARLAALYLDTGALTGEASLLETAAEVVGYMVETLRLPDGPLFAGSQDADESYYALDAAERRRRPTPKLDESVYVDSNARAARALLKASYLLDRRRLRGEALAAIDALWEQGRGRRGMAHYLGGTVDGLLGDQAAMTAALLDAYEVTGDSAYLARAEVLGHWAIEHLQRPAGRFLDRAQTAEAPGLLGVAQAPIDDGAAMADALLRLTLYSGRPAYRASAAAALQAFASTCATFGSAAAAYAVAVCRYLDDPPHIVVVGRRNDSRARELLDAAIRVARPLRAVQLLDPSLDVEHILRAGYSIEQHPAAYVCQSGTCLPPTREPADIARLAAG